MNVNNSKKYLIFLIIIVTGIFMIIYNPLLHGYLPIFNDIGADTYNQNYVTNIYIRSQLSHGNIFNYDLNYGLGTNSFNLLYLNLFQLIYYFVPTAYMGLAMAFGSYLCVLFSAIFSFYIFKYFKMEDHASVIGGILWAFSGFIMLWGQHFDFGVAYATVTIYILLLVRCKFEKINDIYGVVFGLTLILFISYYWLYMVGLFSAVYLLVVTIKKYINSNDNNGSGTPKHIVRYILNGELLLLLAGILSCVLGSFALCRGIEGYLNSARTAAVTTEKSIFGIFYNAQYFVTDVARFFSNNLLGVGNEYTGAYNYYEGTILCTSGLALYGIFYYLFKNKNNSSEGPKTRDYIFRILNMVMLALSISLPVITKYLTFNDKKQRWTFVILFIVIGWTVSFLNDLFKNKIDRKICQKTVGSALGLFFALFVLLFVADRRGLCDVKKTEAIYVIIPFLLYGILILMIQKRMSVGVGDNYNDESHIRKNNTSSIIQKNILILTMLGVVIADMVFLNYDSFNKRVLLKQNDLDNIFFDGSDNAALYVKNTDNDLYRVNKTYMSTLYNDARVQGYNGFSDYNAVEKKSVDEYMLINNIPFAQPGDYSRAGKYINVQWNDYIPISLLGMKYVFSRESVSDNSYLKFVQRVDGVNIYENKNAIPFGYLYFHEKSGKEYCSLDSAGKRSSLLRSFYYTDSIDRCKQNIMTGLKLPSEYQTAYKGTEGLDDSSQKLITAIDSLKKSGAYNIKFGDSKYTAEIKNDSDSEAMMCIPIFYEHEWKAYVDGKKADVSNINGGLIGIKLNSGHHDIKLVYDRSRLFISVVISAIALVCYIMWGVIILKRKNKSLSEKQPGKTETNGLETNELETNEIAEAEIKKGRKKGIRHSRIVAAVVIIAMLISIIALCVKKPWERGWKITQYNTTTGAQAMFYTIENKDGDLAIVDGGYNCDGDISQVLDVIKKHGNHVTTWILTHPHHDHVGAFNGLYPYADKIGIKIDQIYATDANRDRIVEMARDNTDDIETYDDFEKAIEHSRNIKYVHSGDRIKILNGLSAEVYHAWDHEVNETDCNPCNNGSIMFKIFGHKDSMLFCADTEQPIEKYIIARYKNELKADYVQCGHHGSTGLSTDFYDLVGATKGAFFDGPDSLYVKGNNGYTGYILMDYFKKKGVPIYKYSTAPNSITLK